ncbi:MAG: hypothetical protein J6W40_01820 [Alphaproteobacteria bacterium]|nr:hypothetical protein [Alphaproteobacteria bacterium]
MADPTEAQKIISELDTMLSNPANLDIRVSEDGVIILVGNLLIETLEWCFKYRGTKQPKFCALYYVNRPDEGCCFEGVKYRLCASNSIATYDNYSPVFKKTDLIQNQLMAMWQKMPDELRNPPKKDEKPDMEKGIIIQENPESMLWINIYWMVALCKDYGKTDRPEETKRFICRQLGDLKTQLSLLDKTR